MKPIRLYFQKETEEEDFFNYKRSGCLNRLSLKNRKRKREASSSVIQTTPATSNLNNIQVKTEQPYKDLEESQDKRSKVDSQGTSRLFPNLWLHNYVSLCTSMRFQDNIVGFLSFRFWNQNDERAQYALREWWQRRRIHQELFWVH